MRIIHTVLRADFGLLDRNLVRSELLREPGVENVSFEEVALTVEYDPTKVGDSRLIEIMHRYGACTDRTTPTNEEHVETLTDGRRVLIRPIRPDDVERNAAFLEGLSPPSKHFLFLGGVSRLSGFAVESR